MESKENQDKGEAGMTCPECGAEMDTAVFHQALTSKEGMWFTVDMDYCPKCGHVGETMVYNG